MDRHVKIEWVCLKSVWSVAASTLIVDLSHNDRSSAVEYKHNVSVVQSAFQWSDSES